MPEDSFLRVIVTQAWQIALLTVIVGLVVRMFAAEKPQVACWLWLIVVVKCVTPPVWGHSFGLFSQIQSVVAHNAAVPDQVAVHAHVPEVVIDSEFTASSIPVESDLFSTETDEIVYNFDSGMPGLEIAPAVGEEPDGVDVWAFAVWLVIAGGTVSLLWLTFKFAWCLRRIYACRVTEFDDEIEPVVVALAKELRLRRVPRVIISDVRFGPAVLGIFRHLIVLPRCLIADEGCRDLKTLRPILAHELLHIRRGDLLTGTLQAAVQCLWWFHPAVWVVNRFLSRETERSCDEQVVSELGCSPLEYARSLLAVIECKHSLRPVPVFPGMKPVEITSQRMERIMSLKQGCRTRMPWWSVVAVVLFAAVVLPGAVIGQQVAEIKQIIDAESSTENWNGSTGPDKETSDEFAEPNTTKINLESDVSDASFGQTQVHKAGCVFVGGAVTTPVFLDISAAQGITLIEAIAHAGGLSEQAGDIVMVRRKNSSGSYTQLPALSLKAPLSDADASVLIRADDVITVESLDCCLSREKLAKKVTLRFANAPLESVLRLIATEYDVKFAIETGSAITNNMISMSVDEVPLGKALKLICEQSNLRFVDEHGVIKIARLQPDSGTDVAPVRRKLPYNGKIVVDKSLVRSGGGELFYATSVLGKGSVVRVMREDANGWLMIEPPDGSFSWVEKRHVRPEAWGNGEILNSNTVVFVGSALKQELDVWQVRMDAGETVAIFDEQQMSTKTGLTQMLKIQPPTGEYRWIKSSALIPTDEAIRIVEPEPHTQREVIVYSVADLVSPFPEPIASVAGKSRWINHAETQKFLYEIQSDAVENNLVSLIELVETTIEPDSWARGGGAGRLQKNVSTLGIVIRQTPQVHDKIVELLGQLRRSKGNPIATNCELLIFKTPKQIEWLDDNLKFRQHPDTNPWALVPTSGTNDTLKIAKLQSEVISYNPITAFAGTPATMKLSGPHKYALNLCLKCVPFEEGNFIEMEYGVSLAMFSDQKPHLATCVMGNNQTLLVDVSDTRDDSTFRAIAVIRPSIVEGQNREQ